FPTITETFILREMIEMERQDQPVRVVPMIRETPRVIHDAAKPWTDRALYTPWMSGPILRANVRAFLRQPLRYLWLLARLKAGTIASPSVFARTLAVFPKSVFLAGELSREGVKHIHAHYATHPSTMALIIATLSDITFSFTVHAHDIQVNRSLLRWKLRETRFVRSISDFNRRFLEKLYPKEAAGKIVVIHVGIEPAVYEENSRRTAAAAGPPRILCVAAHKPYKGLPVLIEACRILRDEGIELRCDIVGDGPMRDELEALIRERGLAGVVTLAGARPQEEVTRMMAEARLFALPSIIAADGQMEGIPVALMEAMASARAVVTTKISGIPELVDDGVNGLLVEPGDAPAFARAMKELLRDQNRAAEMGRRGQQKVRAEFTLPDCVRQLIARLDEENS
ncbi:MAG TPA: glycosyltransferase family 4 protein, partial [Thermoanaerobaculia bacterium]|nr:glycosyltransferase family 4 protein [Thermoanaerobaculia bacterium]